MASVLSIRRWKAASARSHECVQLGRSLATSRSFHQSVRERFGDLEDVTILLESSSFLERLAGEESRTSGPADIRGRYKPEGEVARGGMGVIYKVVGVAAR